MKDPQLIAGLPLSSWLTAIGATLLTISVVPHYRSTHQIEWPRLIAAALFGVSAVLRAKRVPARRP